jgi:predicted glycosyltransferase
MRKPHIVLEDSFNMEQVRLYLPFSSAVITGNYPHPDLGRKEIRLQTYQEMAYLHPACFKPDVNIREELSLGKEEKYFIIRFVSWNASHDIGQRGLTMNMKRELIRILEEHGRVFLSSENDPGLEFEKYRFPLPPEKMLDALAYAHMFVGEGATMASECAILGTMAIYVNSIERGYVTDQGNKYKLAYNFRNGDGVISKVRELLQEEELKSRTLLSRQKLLDENIDLTAFLVWLTENWPDSFRIVRSDPEFVNRYKGSWHIS